MKITYLVKTQKSFENSPKMKFSSVFFSYLETGEIISRAKKNPTDLLRKSLEKQIAIVLWYEKILFFPALSFQSPKKKKFGDEKVQH